MITQGVDKEYQEYLNDGNALWRCSNSVLYQMCLDYPFHSDGDVIVSKLLMIGRTYAAALERRKNAVESSDAFYYQKVIPEMLRIGPELDERLNALRDTNDSIGNNIDLVLETHKFLVDSFESLTALNKRSLASKYLHFHCPDMFFIYDSRANDTVRSFVKRPSKQLLSSSENYDLEYGVFVCRMIEFQSYLNESLGINATPRELDDFLLSKVAR